LSDPLITAIATAVAGSAAQALTEQAARLLAQITDQIRRKLGGNPRALAVLSDQDGADGSPGRVSALAVLLQQAFHDDPAFAGELAALWRDYLSATVSTSVNAFHGTAGKVVQLRDVYGDLTIN
jgi:hypothetical protein